MRRGRRRPPEDEDPRGQPLGRDGIGLLESVAFFGGLPRRSLRRLADVARQVAYTPGSIVVAAGTPGGAAFFVIVHGDVSVRRDRHELARLGAGEFFGELSLLDGRRRTATCVAVSDVTAIRLTRDAFRELIASDADTAFHVIEVLGGRIRRLEETLDELRGAPARGREDTAGRRG
jgi:CRP/FNR family transcriptional regulator, cyclic AMP receptor protein